MQLDLSQETKDYAADPTLKPKQTSGEEIIAVAPIHAFLL